MMAGVRDGTTSDGRGAEIRDAPLVDTHFHLYTTDMPTQSTAWHRPTNDASIERCLETLDRHGVLFGVVAAASLYGDYNDYVREAVRRHRRLKATAIVKPTVSLYELEAMDRDGFVGIRLQWRNLADPPDLTSNEYRVLLRRIADLGWHVHLNDMGPRLAPTIATLENAGVTTVLDHFGRPDPEVGISCSGFQAVLSGLERGKCWAKLSGGFRVKPQGLAGTYAAELLRVTGGDQLVWGSDWPFVGHEADVTYADTLDMLEAWVPDPAIRRKIGGENPLRLYFAS